MNGNGGIADPPSLGPGFATLTPDQLVTLAVHINTTILALNASIENAKGAGQATGDLESQRSLWQAYYNAVMAKLAVVQHDPNADASLLTSMQAVDKLAANTNNANAIGAAFAQLVAKQ